MSKKMEVHGSYEIRDHVEVAVDVGVDEVCQFIEEYADKGDLNMIEATLMKRKDIQEPRTLLEEQEFEVAKALARKYSLKELNEMYKKAVVV